MLRGYRVVEHREALGLHTPQLWFGCCGVLRLGWNTKQIANVMTFHIKMDEF